MERDTSGRFLPRHYQQEAPGQQTSAQSSLDPSLNPGAGGSRPWATTEGGYQPYQTRETCAPGMSSTTAIMSLVGGAALGAVAMYLMDPNEGEERRSRALDAANRALETGTDAARSAYDVAAHKLHDVWDTVSHSAAGAGSAAYAAMPSRKEMRKSSRRMLGSTADTASDWLESARNMLPSRPRLERHSKYAMEPAGVSLTALGALALGVGAMWLMDARQGRGRRAWLMQKANRVVNETGRMARATGRHLRNKTRGYAHEASALASRGGSMLTDNTIAERVRSALGRLGTRGSSIGVQCAGGCVTLTGRCVADDVDVIVATTRDTYGVDRVNNNLEVGDMYAVPGTTSPTAATPSMTPGTSPGTGNVSA